MLNYVLVNVVVATLFQCPTFQHFTVDNVPFLFYVVHSLKCIVIQGLIRAMGKFYIIQSTLKKSIALAYCCSSDRPIGRLFSSNVDL